MAVNPLVQIDQGPFQQLGAFVNLSNRTFVATVAHGLKPGSACVVTNWSGDRFTGLVAFWNKETDVAIVQGDFGDQARYELSPEGIPDEVKVWIEHQREFQTVKTGPISSVQTTYAPVTLRSGDSGGPVLDSENRLLGVVSGGWVWNRGLTWPGRFSRIPQNIVRRALGLPANLIQSAKDACESCREIPGEKALQIP